MFSKIRNITDIIVRYSRKNVQSVYTKQLNVLSPKSPLCTNSRVTTLGTRHSALGTKSTALGTAAVALFAIANCGSAAAYELPAGNKSESVVGVTVTDVRKTDDGMIKAAFDIDLSKVSMKSNVETVYTPMLVNGTDTARMTPFAIVGHNRLYWNKRNNKMLPVTFYKKELVEAHKTNVVYGENYQVTKTSSTGQPSYELEVATRYADWMEVANLEIDIQNFGCANCVKDIEGVEPFYAIAQTDFVQRTFAPEFVYVTPVAEAVKMREISARAYIDFPVNKIEIYPDYRRNPQELAKIRATIDSVKNDKDIKITALHISGTASPEGSYSNNVRLASGRTNSLKNYVQGLYKFPAGFISTSYEPVDWAGLREFLEMVAYGPKTVVDVDNSANPLGQHHTDSIRYDQFQNINFDPATINETLPNAVQILDIVNSNMEPVARNKKIQTTYPSQYNWLLANVYPALRHSDYRIQFEVKTFSEVDEILEVMATQPSKLSLAELFVAANSQEPGSELYNRAFELAVTMYPDDETANLNAATAAMQRGDLISAQRYMAKVTQETPEADYAQAMLLQLQGNQEEALKMFQSLQNSLNPTVAEKAKAAVEGIEMVNRNNNKNFVPIN